MGCGLSFATQKYTCQPFLDYTVAQHIGGYSCNKALKYHDLGDYNQERVDYIRQLKNELYTEISQTVKSEYFHKSPSIYSELADFNVERMTDDYSKKYDKVDRNELTGMINFAIYLFHLR